MGDTIRINVHTMNMHDGDDAIHVPSIQTGRQLVCHDGTIHVPMGNMIRAHTMDHRIGESMSHEDSQTSA